MSHLTDEDIETIEFAIKMSSEVFGAEYFTDKTEEERNERLARLTAKIEELDDGIEREISFVDYGDESIVAEWNGNAWDYHLNKDALTNSL